MLRLRLTADDLARTRFAPQPAPLVELKLSLMMLRRTDSDAFFGRWRRGLHRTLPATTRPLWDLVSGHLGPPFLDPVSTGLDEGLQEVRATPPELVRAGVERVRADRGIAPPPWVRGLLDGDERAWRLLCRALGDAYETVLARGWPTTATWHRAEFSRYALTSAEHGVAAALLALVPGSRFVEGAWECPATYRREVHAEGRGVILLPTFHWTAVPLVADLPGRPVLFVYPAGPGLPVSAAEPGGDTLAPVLGTTRARALRLLGEPLSTSTMARGLGISIGSASVHATALRAAGLVSSVRDGREVLHARTPLGSLLAGHDTPDQEPTG
ncbi:ArsR/SmtB family transcription factor [Streptacidiphilus jiangxiensis]|uniref:Helix-turn-helix domain-containing protein n=1 Tax=Streptacidiphilus jiangxiensis TaxID=235985 RepID=A0A1H7UNL3_STRJI|nr:winged helix-turn-helix domain-containing protein [Streptacidiphilus jiangxiensis]SEL98561.1 Helix-turn-helix domain-containing protein [Streptacidiphilus jiangxiensis]